MQFTSKVKPVKVDSYSFKDKQDNTKTIDVNKVTFLDGENTLIECSFSKDISATDLTSLCGRDGIGNFELTQKEFDKKVSLKLKLVGFRVEK